MYSVTVPECSSGKTLQEFIEIIASGDSGVPKPGFKVSDTSCTIMLDKKIIARTALHTITVSAGQLVKLFPLAYGG